MSTRCFAVSAALCAVFAIAVPVLDAEVEGKIQSVNATERTITLDNGSTLERALVRTGGGALRWSQHLVT